MDQESQSELVIEERTTEKWKNTPNTMESDLKEEIKAPQVSVSMLNSEKRRRTRNRKRTLKKGKSLKFNGDCHTRLKDAGGERRLKPLGLLRRGQKMKIKRRVKKPIARKSKRIQIKTRRRIGSVKIRGSLGRLGYLPRAVVLKETKRTFGINVCRGGGSRSVLNRKFGNRRNQGHNVCDVVRVKGHSSIGSSRGGTNGPGSNFKPEPPDVSLFQHITSAPLIFQAYHAPTRTQSYPQSPLTDFILFQIPIAYEPLDVFQRNLQRSEPSTPIISMGGVTATFDADVHSDAGEALTVEKENVLESLETENLRLDEFDVNHGGTRTHVTGKNSHDHHRHLGAKILQFLHCYSGYSCFNSIASTGSVGDVIFKVSFHKVSLPMLSNSSRLFHKQIYFIIVSKGSSCDQQENLDLSLLSHKPQSLYSQPIQVQPAAPFDFLDKQIPIHKWQVIQNNSQLADPISFQVCLLSELLGVNWETLHEYGPFLVTILHVDNHTTLLSVGLAGLFASRQLNTFRGGPLDAAMIGVILQHLELGFMPILVVISTECLYNDTSFLLYFSHDKGCHPYVSGAKFLNATLAWERAQEDIMSSIKLTIPDAVFFGNYGLHFPSSVQTHTGFYMKVAKKGQPVHEEVHVGSEILTLSIVLFPCNDAVQQEQIHVWLSTELQCQVKLQKERSSYGMQACGHIPVLRTRLNLRRGH